MREAWIKIILFSAFTILMYKLFGYLGLLVALIGIFLEA